MTWSLLLAGEMGYEWDDGDRGPGEGDAGDKDETLVREWGESEAEGKSGVTGE